MESLLSSPLTEEEVKTMIRQSLELDNKKTGAVLEESIKRTSQALEDAKDTVIKYTLRMEQMGGEEQATKLSEKIKEHLKVKFNKKNYNKESIIKCYNIVQRAKENIPELERAYASDVAQNEALQAFDIDAEVERLFPLEWELFNKSRQALGYRSQLLDEENEIESKILRITRGEEYKQYREECENLRVKKSEVLNRIKRKEEEDLFEELPEIQNQAKSKQQTMASVIAQELLGVIKEAYSKPREGKSQSWR